VESPAVGLEKSKFGGCSLEYVALAAAPFATPPHHRPASFALLRGVTDTVRFDFLKKWNLDEEIY